MKRAAKVAAVIVAAGLCLWLLSIPEVRNNFEEHPVGVPLVLLAIAAYVLFTWKYGGTEKPMPEKDDLPTPSSNFGSAHYAPQQTTPAEGGELVFSGVFFGKSHTTDLITAGGYGAPVCSKPENHTLIVARTRTGKGTRVIVPTLLRNCRASCMVIDPKGENAAITARARTRHSHVQLMNPWGEMEPIFTRLGFQSATYNPLDILDRNDPNAVAIAQSIAGAICPKSDGGKDTYWSEAAASMLTGVLLWLTDQPGETKTLARAREIVTLSRKRLTQEYLVKMAASSAFGGAIRESVSSFLDLAPETYSSVISNLAEHTRFLSDPRIKANTSVSSFSMTDLTGFGKDRPTTIYLIIPPDKVATQKTWLRLMITAGMHTFKRKPPGQGLRCTFLIDEFAALGRLDELPSDIATMAGYGVDFTLIVQGIDQLKHLYKDASAAILSNCAYQWFCNIKDLQSAEYLSKTLGQKTVTTVNRSTNTGSSRGHSGGSTSEGESTSYSETGRWLLAPDEVINLGSDVAILLSPNSRPHYLKPVDYWRLQEVFEPFRENYPSLFWPLFYDPNPYRKGQQVAAPDPMPQQFDGGKYAPSLAPKTFGAPAGAAYDPSRYSPSRASAPPKPAPERKPYDYDLYSPKNKPPKS